MRNFVEAMELEATIAGGFPRPLLQSFSLNLLTTDLPGAVGATAVAIPAAGLGLVIGAELGHYLGPATGLLLFGFAGLPELAEFAAAGEVIGGAMGEVIGSLVGSWAGAKGGASVDTAASIDDERPPLP